MKCNQFVIYVLAFIAIFFLNGCVNIPNDVIANNTTTNITAAVNVPPYKLAKLENALEIYFKLQSGSEVNLTYHGAENNGQFIMLNFTDAQKRPMLIPVSSNFSHLFLGAVDIDEFIAQIQVMKAQMDASLPPTQLQQSDKPSMEVFVMSYCPYGIDMENAVIPVQELLGAKANITIKFVNYAMHGAKEIQENARQYCIQKNTPDKFWSYLKCFNGNKNSSACILSNGINETNVNICINETYTTYGIKVDNTSFLIHDAECKKYGVRGSPTVVINGVVVNVVRSPEGVKKTLCNAFITPPAECSTNLSTTGATTPIGGCGK